jgi:hypothetical protein
MPGRISCRITPVCLNSSRKGRCYFMSFTVVTSLYPGILQSVHSHPSRMKLCFKRDCRIRLSNCYKFFLLRTP